jgi:hypothetical protein
VIWVAWLIFGVGLLLLIALAVLLIVALRSFHTTRERAVSDCTGRVSPLLVRVETVRTRKADSSDPEPLGR